MRGARGATLLRDRGLATSPMFTIPETPRSAEGFLPQDVIQPLVAWLTRLARDARSRDVVIRRTLVGALDSLRDRIPTIAGCADDQVAADERLRDDLDEVYTAATDELEERLCDGTLMRGEVLARWQEFVGTGDLYKSLDATASRPREGAVAGVPAQPMPTDQLDQAVQIGVAALVRVSAQRCADQAVQRWRARPEGASLLEAAGGASIIDQRLASDFDARVGRTLRDWHVQVMDLVRDESANRRGGARAMPLGLDAAALIVMLSVFTHGAPELSLIHI